MWCEGRKKGHTTVYKAPVGATQFMAMPSTLSLIWVRLVWLPPSGEEVSVAWLQRVVPEGFFGERCQHAS